MFTRSLGATDCSLDIARGSFQSSSNVGKPNPCPLDHFARFRAMARRDTTTHPERASIAKVCRVPPAPFCSAGRASSVERFTFRLTRCRPEALVAGAAQLRSELEGSRGVELVDRPRSARSELEG